MPPTHAHDDAAVREKAYYLWEEDGKPHGRDQEYWQRAMVALSSKAKMDTLPKSAPKKSRAEDKPVKIKAAANKTKSAPAKSAPAKKPKKK